MTNLLNKCYVEHMLTYSNSRVLLHSGRVSTFMNAAFAVYTASTDEHMFLEKIKNPPQCRFYSMYERKDVENLSIDFIKQFLLICKIVQYDECLINISNIKKDIDDMKLKWML